jgi:catechol 2,3-dioxygenase
LIWVKAGRETIAQASRMSSELLHDVAHLGAVELLTPQPEKSLWYFRDLLGMEVVHRTTAAAWLRGYGDHAAASL